LDINYLVIFLTRLIILAMQDPLKKNLHKALQYTTAVAKQQICIN